LIWAVSAGRGFTPEAGKHARIMTDAVTAAGGTGADALKVLQMQPIITEKVNAELDWFCHLLDTSTFPEACNWMAVRNGAVIAAPDKQYKYGIPSRSVTRTTGKIAIPEDNASFVNYLVDARKAGEINKVQLKAANDLNDIRAEIQYLSF